MVSKKTIINAIDMLNMDQCEMADRLLNLEIKVHSLESKLRAMIPPAEVKSAPKAKASKKTSPKKKIVKRPVGRPRKNK